MRKALALLSGGLDSRLAIKLIQAQRIRVEALHLKLPFEGCCLPDCAFKFTQTEAIRLHILDVTKGRLFQEYIRLIRKPRFGYGSGINPCIDCHIFMLRKAKGLAKGIGADFIVTGEVLGERPMSQRRPILKLIEEEAGLKGKLLRPLSARLLPETEAEKKGWVDRKKLLEIKGRGRKPQLALAKKYKLMDFPMPAGGCILCEKGFAKRLSDIFEHEARIEPRDIELLKLGRHFRYKSNKIIVGRNEQENKLLTELKSKTDLIFEVTDCGSPVTIFQGRSSLARVRMAARLTARYSDSGKVKVLVNYGYRKPSKGIRVTQANKEEIERLRL